PQGLEEGDDHERRHRGVEEVEAPVVRADPGGEHSEDRADHRGEHGVRGHPSQKLVQVEQPRAQQGLGEEEEKEAGEDGPQVGPGDAQQGEEVERTEEDRRCRRGGHVGQALPVDGKAGLPDAADEQGERHQQRHQDAGRHRRLATQPVRQWGEGHHQADRRRPQHPAPHPPRTGGGDAQELQEERHRQDGEQAGEEQQRPERDAGGPGRREAGEQPVQEPGGVEPADVQCEDAEERDLPGSRPPKEHGQPQGHPDDGCQQCALGLNVHLRHTLTGRGPSRSAQKHRVSAVMTIRAVTRTLSLCALLAVVPLPAFAQDDEPSPAPRPEVPAGTPPEATLSPAPDAEKQPPPGPETRWVRLENPAFPRPVVAEPSPPPPSMIIDEDALAPYFAEGKALEAKAAFDRGHFARARSLLKEVEQTHPVRCLAALAAVHSNEHALAAEEMAALADEYLRVSDRALTHGGKAFYALGRYQEAAGLLERVPTASLMYPEARVFLGRALEKAGDPQAAIRALEPLANRPAPSWGRDLGAAALMQTADIARKAKDTQTERDALESIWAAHPSSPEAEAARSRLGRGTRTRTAQVVHAETRIYSHQNHEGIALTDAFIDTLELPDPLACRAHFNHGKALRKERKHRDAIARLSPVVERCLDPNIRVRALYVLGSSSSIVDHPRAIKVYQQLAREFPEHSFADDALFFTADLLMRRGAHDEALEHLSELARLYPDGDFAGEALFKSFWVHRTRGHHAQALKVLDRIEANYRDAAEPFDYERSRYWRARTQQDLGQGEAALEIFKTLATSRPATYYGLMSRRQSLEADPDFVETLRAALVFPTEGESPWPLDAGTLSTDPHFLTALEYLRLGFPEAVGSELLAANRAGASAEA